MPGSLELIHVPRLLLALRGFWRHILLMKFSGMRITRRYEVACSWARDKVLKYIEAAKEPEIAGFNDFEIQTFPSARNEQFALK